MFSNNLLMAAASASGGGGYSVENSVRMDKASTANMVLNSGSWGTPSSTTSGIISLWTKGGGANELLFHTGPQDGTGNDEFHFEIEASQFATYQRISAAVTFNYKTTQLLRDPTSWYHILVIYNTDDATSTDRIKIFINGVRVTDFATSTAPSSGAVVRFTADENNRIGTRTAVAPGGSMDNYLSQFAKLDGYGSYTEADFGEFDDEGEWRPIDITGLTYGTNGALLDFAVAPGTGNGAGTDVSGNGNNFTDSGLAANDQVTDTPTDNFCTWSPVHSSSGATLANGNLEGSLGTNNQGILGTLSVSSGKWYWEYTIGATRGVPYMGAISTGSPTVDPVSTVNAVYYDAWAISYAAEKYDHGEYVSDLGTDMAAGDIVQIAVDLDNGRIWFGLNDSWWEGDPSAGTGASFTNVSGPITPAFQNSSAGSAIIGNFGQTGGLTYTPPTDFLELKTSNMTALDFDVNEHHQVELVNHDGSSTSFTLNWDADTYDTLFIIKNRDNIEKWFWVDGLRGYNKYISSDETTAGTTDANVISVSGTTITLGSSSALSSDNYVIECHRAGDAGGAENTDGSTTTTVSANTTTGFSIMTFTTSATASGFTYGHGLGVALDFLTVKDLTNVGGWWTWHNTLSADEYLRLETNGAVYTDGGSAVWDNAIPTSSVFSSQEGGAWLASDAAHVAYGWAAVEGYSAFGSYVGNGSSDGPMINPGIKPNTFFVKSSSTGGSSYEWNGLYAEANGDVNGAGNGVQWSTDAAESSGNNVDLLSNGAKIRLAGIGFNGSGVTYIYMAWGTPTVDKSETPAKAR